MAHDSREVANALLEIGKRKGVKMSMMKLIKLVFFAHGWHLGIYGTPLCSDRVEAWRYGPVFPDLYRSLPYKGSEIVKEPIIDSFFGIPLNAKFTEQEERLLEKIVDAYGHLNAFQLSDITHENGSPWYQTCYLGLFAKIDNEVIRDYYAAKLKENRRRRSA